jgi:hypothetical protein
MNCYHNWRAGRNGCDAELKTAWSDIVCSLCGKTATLYSKYPIKIENLTKFILDNQETVWYNKKKKSV